MATDGFQTLSPGIVDANSPESLFHEAVTVMDDSKHSDLISRLDSEDPSESFAFGNDLGGEGGSSLTDSFLFHTKNEPLYCKTEDQDDDEDNGSVTELSPSSSPSSYSPVTQQLQNESGLHDTNTTLSLINRSARLKLEDRTLDQNVDGHSTWGLITAEGEENLGSSSKVRKSTRDSDASANLALLDDDTICPSPAFESSPQITDPSDFTFRKFGQNLQGEHAAAGPDVNLSTLSSQSKVSDVEPLLNKKTVSALTPIKTTSKGGAYRSIKKIKEPALNLSYPSKFGERELQIVNQPEEQHRARYLTEGSRGAIKDRSQNGFPAVKLLGYDEQVKLQIFIGNDQGKVKPHGFYQACQVCGKNATQSTQRDIDGTTVIEMQILPSNDMIATIDCVGILKLRNADVEQRIGLARSKKRSTRARIVFRVNIPNPDGTFQTLQVASQPILCTQPPGAPEITKKCFSEVNPEGGQELFIIGKNFSKGSKAFFVETDADGKEVWSAEAEIDQDNFHQTHMIITVPRYKVPSLAEPVQVNIHVHSSGRVSEPSPIMYKSGPVLKEEQATLTSMISAHVPMETEASTLVKAVSPVALEYNKIFQEAVIKGEMTSQLLLQSNISSQENSAVQHQGLSALEEVLKQESGSSSNWLDTAQAQAHASATTHTLPQESQPHGQKRTIQQILNDDAIEKQQQQQQQQQQEQQEQQQQKQQQQQQQQVKAELSLPQVPVQSSTLNQLIQILEPKAKSMIGQVEISQQEKATQKQEHHQIHPNEAAQLNILLHQLLAHVQQQQVPQQEKQKTGEQMEPHQDVSSVFDIIQPQQQIHSPDQYHTHNPQSFISPPPETVDTQHQVKQEELLLGDIVKEMRQLQEETGNQVQQVEGHFDQQTFTSNSEHTFVQDHAQTLFPNSQQTEHHFTNTQCTDIMQAKQQSFTPSKQSSEQHQEQRFTELQQQSFNNSCPAQADFGKDGDVFPPSQNPTPVFCANQPADQGLSANQHTDQMFVSSQSATNLFAQHGPEHAASQQIKESLQGFSDHEMKPANQENQSFAHVQQNEPEFQAGQTVEQAFSPTQATKHGFQPSQELQERLRQSQQELQKVNQFHQQMSQSVSSLGMEADIQLKQAQMQCEQHQQQQLSRSSSECGTDQHMESNSDEQDKQQGDRQSCVLKQMLLNDSGIEVHSVASSVPMTADEPKDGSTTRTTEIVSGEENTLAHSQSGMGMPGDNVTIDDLLNFLEGDHSDMHNKVHNFLRSDNNVQESSANKAQIQLQANAGGNFEQASLERKQQNVEMLSACHMPPNQVASGGNNGITSVATSSPLQAMEVDGQVSLSQREPATPVITQPQTPEQQQRQQQEQPQPVVNMPSQKESAACLFPADLGNLPQVLRIVVTNPTDMPTGHSAHSDSQAQTFVMTELPQQIAVGSSELPASSQTAIGLSLSASGSQVQNYTINQLLTSGMVHANVKTVNQVPLVITPDLQKSQPQQQSNQQELLQQPQIALTTQNAGSKVFQAVATTGPQLIQVIPSSQVQVQEKKVIQVPELQGKNLHVANVEELAALLVQKDATVQLQSQSSNRSHEDISIPTQRQPIMVNSSTHQPMKMTLTQPIVLSTGKDSKIIAQPQPEGQPQTLLLNIANFSHTQSSAQQSLTQIHPQIAQPAALPGQAHLSLSQPLMAPSGVFNVVPGSSVSAGSLNSILVNQPITIITEQDSSHVNKGCNGFTSLLETSGGSCAPTKSQCWGADLCQKNHLNSSPDLVMTSWCGKMQPDAGNYTKSTTVTTNITDPCNDTAPWSCASSTDGILPDLHAIMDVDGLLNQQPTTSK